MASSHSMLTFSATPRFLLVLLATLLFSLNCVSCVEFQVGERVGWVVPPPTANDTKFYNQWASKKRFKVGDAICFKYKKDSVMEVSKTNYESCNSTRPNFFSNTGDTIYTLDRSGFFYFMSGATGHCDMGQKLIIWVIEQAANSSASSAGNSRASMFSYAVVFAMAAFHFL